MGLVLGTNNILGHSGGEGRMEVRHEAFLERRRMDVLGGRSPILPTTIKHYNFHRSTSFVVSISCVYRLKALSSLSNEKKKKRRRRRKARDEEEGGFNMNKNKKNKFFSFFVYYY